MSAPNGARAVAALDRRLEAARSALGEAFAPPSTNGDEERYPSRVACYSKALPHDARGEVAPAAYGALLHALDSGREEDFEAVPLGGSIKLANPQAAFAFSLEGADPHQLPLATPPRLDSAEQAAEAVELYWQALTRDVPFASYESEPLTLAAAGELSKLRSFTGPRHEGQVTPATLFRGIAAGDLTGPYLSQFLWKTIPYGAIRVVQHVRTATPGFDYLTQWEDWLAVRNGAPAQGPHAASYHYIRSGRDLAAYVHADFTCQAFLSACLSLFGMQGTTDARIFYKGAPFDPGNPYLNYRVQASFGTFGVAHVLDLVTHVAGQAVLAAWYPKWLVHRRLRPEAFGGLVHLHGTGHANRALHETVLGSEAVATSTKKHGTGLLPQAYPEGSPTHPSYPAAHAVVAGACATVLKAFFDESFPIDDPVVASSDGRSLIPYTGPTLSIGGELDKLASNVALGRDAAGIHWRSDSAEGLRLGECVAMAMLHNMAGCFNERCDGLSVRTFAGATVRVLA